MDETLMDTVLAHSEIIQQTVGGIAGATVSFFVTVAIVRWVRNGNFERKYRNGTARQGVDFD
jgi:hypothetical protein